MTSSPGEAADGQDALDQLAQLERSGRLPDVVLLDLVMPRMDGMTAMKAMRQQFPPSRWWC
ncbi:response regulator [Nesterenkonia pannonica]|uniref:response regulator n=1 Tax=Nesterenkonia pannonica TaxID=1548602 RepID=UPI0021649FA2|nr:response regulator [Nesterenkonia pannonica]